MSIPFLHDIILKHGNKIQFTTNAGANAGSIDIDNSGNLVLNNTAGDILLGDGASDVYIGDGTNNVDILFEQSGAIKADDSATGVTITLGSSNTTLAFGGSTNFTDIVNSFSPTGTNTIDIGTNLKPFKDIYAAHHVGGNSINYATSRGWVEDPAPLSVTQVGYFGGNFTRNGSEDENAVVWGIDPFGNKALLWKCILNQPGNNDDGGWNKDITIPANNNIGYLSYFYFKFDFTPNEGNDGQFYHGCGTTAGETINLADDSNNTNPYFNNGNIYNSNNGAAFFANRWYLTIGIIQAYNNETTDVDTITGVYDVETGQKVRNGSEFKMGNNTTGQRHRAYIYYDTTTDNNENAYFWNPGFHAIDGSEPKLQDLLKRQAYLPDNVKAAFGDSNDLNIYHNGSHSFIQDTGTGDLRLLGSKIRLQSTTEENMLIATPDAGVTLYYNNSAKFETYNAGVGVTGNAYLTSGNHIHFDNGVSNNYYVRKNSSTLEFKTGGTYNFLSGDATFAGVITYGNSTGVLTYGSDRAILRAASSKALELQTNGGTTLMTGVDANATFAGNITLGANHIGRDADNYIGFATDNLIKFRVNGATQVKLSDGVFAPQTDSDVDLGSNGTRFANVYADTLYGDGSNLTNLPAQDAPANMVTTDSSQTITHAKNFTSTSNQFNGHIYFNAYDSQGNHYPHFRDGSASNGANINIRHYYGSANYKTHVMSSDSSGNMQFDFQGTLKGDALTIDGGVDINGNTDISGTLTSGNIHVNSASDGILTLNQTGTDTGWSYINFNTSGTRNWYVGQDNNKNFDIYNDNTDSLGLSIDYANNSVSVGALSATTLNTGHGANELYAMNQNVRTTDNVTFDDLTVTGNLTITGDINSYNVTDLDVTDKTITIGKGQTESNSGGSGIIVDGASASILWDESNSLFDFNKNINIETGSIALGGDVTLFRDGANILRTDDAFHANNSVYVGGAGKLFDRADNNNYIELADTIQVSTDTKISGNLTVGPSATTGGRILSQTYTSADRLGVISSHASSGNLLIGYGAEGKTSASGDFVSTYGNFSGGHSALSVSGTHLRWYSEASNSTTAVGNDLTLANVFSVDRSGNVALSGTVDGVDIQTLNTTANAALPLAGGTMTGDLIIDRTGDNVSNISLRRDTTADNTIVGDINWLNSNSEGTDDRLAIIRAATQGGNTSNRGGQLSFFTRLGSSSAFRETVVNQFGDWSFYRNLTISTGSGAGTIKLPVGSSSAPSLTFINNTDSGIYSTDGTSVTVTVDGTQRLNVHTTGISTGTVSGTTGTFTGAVTSNGTTLTGDQDLSNLQPKPSEGAFANGDKTKLDGIAASADVTPSWVPSSNPNYSTATGVANNADVTPSWVPSSNPGYLTSSGTIAQANNLQAFDDRDMAPEDLSYSDDLKLFFSAKEGLEDGTSTSSNWQDVLVLNSYSDSSGGNANVLAFDKSEKKIYHYQAGLSASNWGTAKELAYTDAIPSGNQIIDWTAENAGTIHSSNYTNTTYSVGDGGLTQNNFTNADHSKLDGIAAGADVTPSWVPSSDPSYLTGITSGQVTTALGFTPMNSNVITISGSQASAITANTAKTGITSAQSQKLGYITVTQAVNLDTIESNAATALGWGNHASAGYSTATGVANNADVTPSWVPSSNPNYLTAAESVQVNNNSGLFKGSGNTPTLKVDLDNLVAFDSESNEIEKIAGVDDEGTSTEIQADQFMYQTIVCHFSQTTGSTSDYLIPMNHNSEATSAQYYHMWVPPHNGRVETMIMKHGHGSAPTLASAAPTRFRLAKNSTSASYSSSYKTRVRVEGRNDDYYSYIRQDGINFGFNAGDRVYFKFQNGSSSTVWRNCSVSIVVRYNLV